MVSPHAIFQVLGYVYATLLRPVLLRAVDDPAQEWDDVVMAVVDRVFDYTPAPPKK